MPILSNDPSTSTKTASDLEAELAAMEEEEAAEDSEDSGSKPRSGAEEGKVIGSREAVGTRIAAENL